MSFGEHMINLRKQIAVSLYLAPATLDELCEREFLENIADFNVDRLLMRLEKDKWIFINKAGRYQTYRKIAATELKEWDLVLD